MLSPSTRSKRIAPLEQLVSGRAWTDAHEPDWTTPIDRTRWFICETLTPLYYTPCYAALGSEHRRRYNQLTGMLANEIILHLETGFLDDALGAVAHCAPGANAELVEAVHRFRRDERRHAESWRRLNRLSEPAWYRNRDRYLLRVPAVAESVARIVARHPVSCPVVFWIQLVQEERSIEISKRCLRMPGESIEPRYAAVYGEHLRDEVRHIQVDCHLIERFHAAQSRTARKLTARAFRWVLSRLFLRPARSTMRVIEVLASEYRELRPLRSQMARQLRTLVSDQAYHEMMYSRTTTPITFDLFDAFPEFHSMRKALRAYVPAHPGGRA